MKMLMFSMFCLNIRHISLFSASLLLCVSAHAAEKTEFNNKTPLGEDLEVMAFVGRKISFDEKNLREKSLIPMPDGTVIERIIPSFDTRYEARYKVLTWVSEDLAHETIDFEVYDHYGRPALPKITTPLVLLVNDNGRWVQSKYNNYSLSQTTDGDWGICGQPARHEKVRDQGERYVQPLTFINPIKDRHGNICRSGTRVADILKYQYETRFLPDKWRVTCNLELGLPRNIIAGTGSAPDAEQIGLAHTACVERLKFEEDMLRD